MPKLYIGNLSYSATTEDLEALFSRVGKVESAAVVADKFSGRSKGFGFVEMADSNDAIAAIESLNESEFQGRRIKVAEARSGDQRGNGDGGNGGNGGRGARPG
ncbi:MAG TPA: RNA-binding protein, partial [Candidatus Binataceae bacterium]